jgi:hypothetical protein
MASTERFLALVVFADLGGDASKSLAGSRRSSPSVSEPLPESTYETDEPLEARAEDLWDNRDGWSARVHGKKQGKFKENTYGEGFFLLEDEP